MAAHLHGSAGVWDFLGSSEVWSCVIRFVECCNHTVLATVVLHDLWFQCLVVGSAPSPARPKQLLGFGPSLQELRGLSGKAPKNASFLGFGGTGASRLPASALVDAEVQFREAFPKIELKVSFDDARSAVGEKPA